MYVHSNNRLLVRSRDKCLIALNVDRCHIGPSIRAFCDSLECKIFLVRESDAALFNQKVEALMGSYMAFGHDGEMLSLAKDLLTLFEAHLGRQSQYLKRAVAEIENNMRPLRE